MIAKRLLVLCAVLAALLSGYAIAENKASIEPLSFYSLNQGNLSTNPTRLDLVVLHYGDAAIPCVVSLTIRRDGFVNQSSGTGISCDWSKASGLQK